MNRPNILIVEDNKDLRLLIKMALERKGFIVHTSENGKEALERIDEEGMPDLILLDMKMPIMNGWEFSNQFSKRYGNAVPIVVMTAAQDSKARADEIGARSFLGKPFQLGELFDCVDTMLSAS